MASSIKRVSIKRQLQQFSVQDKLDAIQRVNEGESKASVARDIGVPESTLRGWCKSEDKLRCSSTELENDGGIIGDGGLAGLCNGTLDVVGPSTKRARSSDNPVTAMTATATTTKDPELDEALWYWLRQQQQHVAGLSEQLCHAAAASAVQQQQQHHHHHQQPSVSVKSQSSASAAAVAAAAAAAVAATTGAMVSSAAADLNPSTGWFWRWYKRYGLAVPDALGKVKQTDSALPLMTTSRISSAPTTSSVIAPTNTSLISLNRTPAPAHTPQPAHTHSHTSTQNPSPAHIPVHALAPAHHQQALPAHSACQPTNLHVSSSSVMAAMQAAAAAPSHSAVAPPVPAPAPEPDEPSDDEDDEPPLSAAEAVAHGEKFLRWLDCCSDPSVTALQILQFRYLLNNVRACAARRAKAAANRDKS
jgi:hypothetical protein